MINKKLPHISYTINALNYDRLKLINEIKNDENIEHDHLLINEELNIDERL